MTDDTTINPAAEPKTFIVIASRWGNHPADSVLEVVPGLLEHLADAGVEHREATGFERLIGGFPD